MATRITRRALIGAGVGAFAASTATAAVSHELVMVEDAGCIYCARWHAEVGRAYANSAEGRFAPLLRVRIGEPRISHLLGLRYTPTFVLVQGPREIGRITGYPGADFFWGLLGKLLGKTSFGAPEPDDLKT